MDFDVIVSGAGLTGTATALSLHQQGLRVALVDTSEAFNANGRFGFDLRTLALSPANLAWLDSLGVVNSLPRYPIERMQVWEHDGSGSVTFDSKSVGLPNLAVVFEHSPLIDVCRTNCKQEVEMLESTHIVEIDNPKQSVKLNNGLQLSCRLLCIAEGPNSTTRKIAGATCRKQTLAQSALVTFARSSDGHQNTAWQKFDEGILAFLPFEDNFVSVIWSLDNSRCKQMMSLRETDFARLLSQVSERVCGEIVEVDERRSFPLHQSLADTFSPKPWIALIGDAAHTLHPLSGQGVNLGLEDARALLQSLKIADMKSIRSASITSFAQHRRLKAKMMIRMMSFFLNTWSWERPTSRWVRNIGVRSFDKLGFLKQQVIREAIGYGPLGGLS